MKNTRPDLISELEQKINAKRTQNRRHLHAVKYRNENLLKINLENVENKRKEMHEAVDIIINEHIDSIKSHSAGLDAEVKEQRDKIEEEESALVNMIENFRDTAMVGLDLMAYYETLRTKVDVLPTIDLSQHCNTQLYLEGEIDLEGLNKMIGLLQEIETSVPTLTQISSFQHNDNMSHTIIPRDRDAAWITYNTVKEFTLLKRYGHHIKSVPKDSDKYSFIIHDNAFLHCNSSNQTILKIDMSGNTTIWMDVSPLSSRFIGQAINENILITLVDENSVVRTYESERKVQMLSPSGNVLHTYEYGEDGVTPVLTCLGRVVQNYNSDVCVANQYDMADDDRRGNIVVFYEDDGLKFQYDGHGGKFSPSGLCCDSLCNIICSNFVDDTIHILHSDGSFLQYLLTSESCAQDPIALALHRGVLWIGSDRGEIRVYKYMYDANRDFNQIGSTILNPD